MRAKTRTVWVATQNSGKIREFAAAFAPLGWEIKSLYDLPDVPDIVEDGETFAENAVKKAKALSEKLGVPVLADDSGLCVDALGGAPGVLSARYAGRHGDDRANNEKLVNELLKQREREDGGPSVMALPGLSPGVSVLSRARFVCALALCRPEGTIDLAEGECYGWIIDRPLGDGGFGYDPLFFVESYGRTMAQLTVAEKGGISHRGQALRNLLQKVRL